MSRQTIDDCAERCDGCGAIIRPGDLAHHCEDGEWLCKSCAPTWADCGQQAREIGGERLAEYEAALARHIAAGGTEADLAVSPLDGVLDWPETAEQREERIGRAIFGCVWPTLRPDVARKIAKHIVASDLPARAAALLRVVETARYLIDIGHAAPGAWERLHEAVNALDKKSDHA